MGFNLTLTLTQRMQTKGAPAGSVEHATLDLRVLSLRPTLGIDIEST